MLRCRCKSNYVFVIQSESTHSVVSDNVPLKFGPPRVPGHVCARTVGESARPGTLRDMTNENLPEGHGQFLGHNNSELTRGRLAQKIKANASGKNVQGEPECTYNFIARARVKCTRV